MSKHYHFIGIGGVGMGAMASLLLAKGFRVSGSDVKDNPLIARLRREGAEVFIGHAASNINGADSVIYSSAISADNPEMVLAKEERKEILKRAEMLADLMNPQIGIAVAGAHGKTTTTSMISGLLIKAGFNPTTMVGGTINGGSYNANLGDGKYFVAEVDESDGSFLYFSPYYSVITNIDFEHLDYYGHWDNILAAYQKFIDRTQPEGTIVAWGEDTRLQELLKKSKSKFITYGLGQGNVIAAQNITMDGYRSTFEVTLQGKSLGLFSLRVPGRHNILNALAALGIGRLLNIDPQTIRAALSEFNGVVRRFQFKGKVNDISVVDDYGHHPTEIANTLKTAKQFNCRRVVTVFQPHRYTRTKYLLDDFAEQLSLCDYLIVTDIYAAGEKAIEGVSSQALYEKIKQYKKTTVIYLKKEAIVAHLLAMTQSGDLVLTLGAGDITKISDEFVDALQGRIASVHK